MPRSLRYAASVSRWGAYASRQTCDATGVTAPSSAGMLTYGRREVVSSEVTQCNRACVATTSIDRTQVERVAWE